VLKLCIELKQIQALKMSTRTCRQFLQKAKKKKNKKTFQRTFNISQNNFVSKNKPNSVRLYFFKNKRK